MTIVDSMDNAGPWQALAPDGVTPSTAISFAVEVPRPRPGAGPFTGRVSGSGAATSHRLRRALPPLDLSQFDELRFWVASDRPADGTPARPFFLEMRLASAALPLSDPGNTWQRHLPVSQTGTWEPVRLTLGDLPGAVRSAVTVVQLQCTDATAPFTCYIDDLIAVRDEMIGDVDAALRDRLHNTLVLNGNPVAAVLHPANSTLARARPYFEITHYDLVYSPERSQSTRARGDFTDTGYSVRPASIAYDLYYQITAVADDRVSQSRMLELILRRLTPRGDLLINGLPLPMETIVVKPEDQPGGVRTDGLPLFYKLLARQDQGPGERVAAARTVSVDGDVRVPALEGR